MDRLQRQLAETGPPIRALLEKVPLQDTPPLPRDWLRTEILERFRLLEVASVRAGSRVLEVGAGPHAIATVPLAYLVGRNGTLVAAERDRWTHFREVVEACGVTPQIRPVKCDARELPFLPGSFELACCVHGIRSLGADEEVTRVLREMLRVAGALFIAESLPEARTEAQRAHLAMYNIRADVFEATTGRRDDPPYRPLAQLAGLVEAAGGRVEESRVVDLDLPHALAYFPRSRVESVPDPGLRESLLARWDAANQLAKAHGTDHPPAGVVLAAR